METNITNTTTDRVPKIKCIQVNLKHAKAATANLMKIAEEERTDIICIQEPYTFQSKLAGIPKSYKTFTSTEGRSRAAVVATNNLIDVTLIQQLSDVDTVVVEIIKGNLKIILVCMYFDRERLIEQDLAKIDAALRHAKGTGVLIAIDSNARSTLWHDTLTNIRGRILEEFIASNQLSIMNEDSCHTTFRNHMGTSNIDLTLISPQLIRSVTGWVISDQESISDHSIIKYTIGPTTGQWKADNVQNTRYITSKDRLAKFQGNLIQIIKTQQATRLDTGTEDMDETLSLLMTEERDIERRIDEFSEVINLACNKSFLKQRATKKATTHKTVPWWTQELTVLRKRTNAQRRLYQRTRNNDDLREKRKAEYATGKATYAATIKREKTRSWQEYCNMTTADNPWNAVYNLAAGRRNTTTQITTLRKSDGTFTTDTKDTLRLMLNYFTPEDNARNDTEYHKKVRAQTQESNNTADDKDFTVEEIREAIETMDNKKAPGEDGITGDIYKHIFSILPKTITAMYNGCLREGVFPKRWKRAQIIPIIKPGKEDSYDVSKYRPISLLNVAAKVLEKVMINRINYYAHTNDYLNKNQYGFTPQQTTIDAVMAVKDFTEVAFSSGEIVTLVSLDVEGAFNSAWWPNVLKSLNESGCPRNLYKLTRSYLSQRQATLQTNNIRLDKEVTRGCPQGSCCGPGLWNLQYNTLLNLNYTNRTKAIAYADDLIILVRGKTTREVENITNIELSKISLWAKDNKIRFNELKSKVMLLTRRKRRERKELEIYLNYKLLKQVNTLKYLGIILDSKLTFRQHVTAMTDKCTKLIFTLSKSAKLNWGLNYAALKTIYTGGILPLLLYGAPVWSHVINKTYYKRKITRVQRLINIKIAKAYRTVSSDALCLITGLTPIDIKIEEAAQLYQFTRGNSKVEAKFDQDTGVKYWLHPAVRIYILPEDNEDNSTTQIFTDGSKSEQGVGAGIAIYRSGTHIESLKYRLNHRCTNNQAEQLAILKALEHIGNIQTPDKTVTIYTDSRTTLDSLQNSTIHTSLIDKIRRKVMELEQDEWKIQICWVKAHAGIPGNELADTLAKRAASDSDIAECYNKIPKSVVKSDLKNRTIDNWQRDWDRSTKGKITKDYFPTVAERLTMNITTSHKFTTMVTGHGNVNAYLHRFKVTNSPLCPCGKADQTTDHLLYECILLKSLRDTLRLTISKSEGWPIDKNTLITKYYKAFTRFVNQIPLDNFH